MPTSDNVQPLYLRQALGLFQDWLILRGLRSETLRGYSMDSQQFLNWIETEINAPIVISSIKVQHVEAFMQYLLNERECKPRSVNRKLNTLSMLFTCMMKKKLIVENPVDAIDSMKFIETVRTFLTRAEIEAVIEAIEHPVVHYFVMMMAYTGMRVNECRHLKLTHVNFTEGSIQIIDGKGGKNRLVPINSLLNSKLSHYLEVHRPITDSLYFFALKRSGTVSVQYVNRLLQEACQKTKIEKHVTSHVLRHSFASYLVQKKVHIAIIQKLLGHASLKTTSVYLHVQQDSMKTAIEQLDFLEKECGQSGTKQHGT